MTNRIWISNGEYKEGRIAKKGEYTWQSVEVSENDTLYSMLIKWYGYDNIQSLFYGQEPSSTPTMMVGRVLGNGNILDIPPRHLYWTTQMDSLGNEPCLLVVSYYAALQYTLFGKYDEREYKME